MNSNVSFEGYLNEISKVDWNFSTARGDLTSYLTHNYHQYSSKYIPQIPHNLINICTKKGMCILDPFCGSGTTLVEALLLDRKVIGIDINPLACLISRVKSTRLTNYQISAADQIISEMHKRSKEVAIEKLDFWLNDQYSFLQTRFSKKNLEELLFLQNAIRDIKDKQLMEFFLVTLSSIARRCSLLASNFGNDLVPRKERNPISPLVLFEKTGKSMIERMRDFVSQTDGSVKAKVMEGDARNLATINESTFDMIMTHPPYLASVPYAEYQRVELTLLGYDYRRLNQLLIGGKRGKEELVIRFDKDMRSVFNEMFRVLRNNSICSIVIGNPKYLGRTRLLNENFKGYALDSGFVFLKEIERAKKDTTNAWMQSEYIQIFAKQD
jgi:site-specific DNA-methyltransferase (cytosine-N4-specific)